MKTLLLIFAFLLSPFAHSQTAATVTNFSVRAFDTAQTCYDMATVPNWHERMSPVRTCVQMAAWNSGMATGSWLVDSWLRKHGHPRLAQFQWISAAGSGVGIAYSFTHTRY